MTAAPGRHRPGPRRGGRGERRTRAVVATLALVAAACTAGGSDESAPTTTVATTPGSTAARPAPTAARAVPTTATASTDGVTSTTVVDVTDLPVGPDGAPVPPAGPAEAAARIVAVERALRDGAPVDGLGHHHQVLYRTVNRHPGWLPGVLGAVDDATAVRISAILDAGNSSASTVGRPLESIPAWTIRSPRPADELLGHYRAAEEATGVPWSVLAAVNLVETRMGRIVGNSSAGAQGPMQFMPTTWDAYGQGGDVTDDGDAVAAAARLLADAGAPSDLPAALHAYNPNDSYVASVLAYHQVLQADPWVYGAFHGWQVYVSTVQGLLWLEEGFAAREPVPLTPTSIPPTTGAAGAGSGG